MHCRGRYRISKRGTRLLLTTKTRVHVCDVFSLFMKFGSPPKRGGGVPDPQDTPPPLNPPLHCLGEHRLVSYKWKAGAGWCMLHLARHHAVSCLALSWPVSQSATGPHWPPTPDTQCMTPPAPGTIGPGVEVLC